MDVLKLVLVRTSVHMKSYKQTTLRKWSGCGWRGRLLRASFAWCCLTCSTENVAGEQLRYRTEPAWSKRLELESQHCLMSCVALGKSVYLSEPHLPNRKHTPVGLL